MGVGAKEYALRSLKLFVELCDMNRMIGFYKKFKYDIKLGIFEHKKADRNIYDFTELLEAVGVSESCIYEFLCYSTKEDLENRQDSQRMNLLKDCIVLLKKGEMYWKIYFKQVKRKRFLQSIKQDFYQVSSIP